MCSNTNLYNTFARKSSLNGDLAKQKFERLPRNGNRTTAFSKLLVTCVLVLLCLLPALTQQGVISQTQVTNNARSLTMKKMENGPWSGLTRSTLDDPEFQMIVEKWADFEDRMQRKWEHIEYLEHDAWHQLLFGTWLTASLMMDKSSDRTRIFEDWLDMCHVMGMKRVHKNKDDKEILDDVIRKLKYKAFNKLIKNWDVEVEDYWQDIVRMKMEKNMEWCNILRNKCNALINYYFS